MQNIIKYIVKKIKFRKKVKFDYSVTVSLDSKFEGYNYIYSRTFFSGSLGFGSYISSDCSLVAYIGRYSSIGPHVRSNEGVHPTRAPYVSTCAMFFSTRKQNGHTFASCKTFEETKPFPIIGNDCWIGENAFLCPGIKIGDGAIVYAGAVVTKDVPPYTIVAGVPAKVIRKRYDDYIIHFLLDVKWWYKSPKWLQEHWTLFCDIDKFINALHPCGIIYKGTCDLFKKFIQHYGSKISLIFPVFDNISVDVVFESNSKNELYSNGLPIEIKLINNKIYNYRILFNELLCKEKKLSYNEVDALLVLAICDEFEVSNSNQIMSIEIASKIIEEKLISSALTKVHK